MAAPRRAVSDPDRPTTLQLALRATSDALDGYAANPALRAAVVIAVPFVGAAFDTLAGTAGSNVALDRMRVWLNELAARIAWLEDAKRDQTVTTDDVVDATIRAVRGAIDTSDRDKVRMLASILVGATSVDRPAELDAESVVASLVSLTPADLAYARKLVDAPSDSRYASIDFARMAQPGPDSQFRMMRLQGAGLIDATSGSGLGSGPKFDYRFTPTMWRILDFLRAGGETIGADEVPPS